MKYDIEELRRIVTDQLGELATLDITNGKNIVIEVKLTNKSSSVQIPKIKLDFAAPNHIKNIVAGLAITLDHGENRSERI